MAKKFSVDEADIQHYVPPELSGHIVGMRDESLRPQTVEELEAIQQQAFEEGRQQGFEKGMTEAAARARQLESIFNFLQRPLDEMDQQVEHQLADLAVVLARSLLKKESSLDARHIDQLVHESIEYLPVKARDIRVRLNPADIALLNQADIDIHEQNWNCISDPSVSVGGCLIESDTSHVDASVETRVQQLVDQLNLHHAAGSDDAAE